MIDDIRNVWIGVNPYSGPRTPNVRPNGITPMSMGATALTPR